MGDAFDAAESWKRTFLADMLGWLNALAGGGTPEQRDYARRLTAELAVLDGADKKAAYDTIEKNLKTRIRVVQNAKDNAHDPDVIVHWVRIEKKLLLDLQKEGRPA
jgi:galactokinase/mevalonate kinase-like predicted kinase